MSRPAAEGVNVDAVDTQRRRPDEPAELGITVAGDLDELDRGVDAGGAQQTAHVGQEGFLVRAATDMEQLDGVGLGPGRASTISSRFFDQGHPSLTGAPWVGQWACDV